MVRPLLSHQTINNVVSLGTTASATSPYRNRSGGGAEVACPCMVNNPYAAYMCAFAVALSCRMLVKYSELARSCGEGSQGEGAGRQLQHTEGVDSISQVVE